MAGKASTPVSSSRLHIAPVVKAEELSLWGPVAPILCLLKESCEIQGLLILIFIRKGNETRRAKTILKEKIKFEILLYLIFSNKDI